MAQSMGPILMLTSAFKSGTVPSADVAMRFRSRCDAVAVGPYGGSTASIVLNRFVRETPCRQARTGELAGVLLGDTFGDAP